tara:strand:- start:633 stop:1244 length:612 start_codon:yes stop_codon:yes gene_type:complete
MIRTKYESNEDSNSDTININLRKNDLLNDIQDKTTTAYIISQNRKIAHENKLLIIEKVSLEKEIYEKDDELGRTEKSNVHLKGILKNFKELSDIHSNISISRELMIKDIQNDIFNFQQDIIQIRNISFIGYGIYISLMFFIMSWSSFIIQNISIIPFIISLFYLSLFKLSSSKIILNDIRQKKKIIKDIENSLDYINEYIDSI